MIAFLACILFSCQVGADETEMDYPLVESAFVTGCDHNVAVDTSVERTNGPQLPTTPQVDKRKAGDQGQVPRAKSFLRSRNWILGDPNNVFWFAIFVAYVSWRVFHTYSPHHEIGSVAAVSAAIGFFGLQVLSGIDGNMIMSVSVAGFAYSIATLGCWLEHRRSEREESRVIEPEPEVASPLSDQIAEIQADLESQLNSISESPFDNETLEDLKETAKQAAVERMAQILESD